MKIKVTDKKTYTLKDIPVGECFKFTNSPDICLKTDNMFMPYVNLETGSCNGWTGNVIPLDAEIVED